KPLDPSKCNVDWKGKIQNSPTTVGFDYFYGISASLDMPPYIWIHNDSFVGECTTAKAFHRSGPAHKDFFDYDVLPTIAKKASEFIQKQATAKKPFFLYVPLNAPHTPISPSKSFRGKSGLGKYADFVMETDWAVGQIVAAVDQANLSKNTLVIVTADNGCSPAAASRGGRNSLNLTFRQAKAPPPESGKHYASGIYRGHKADIYEGGHRVPFIARWNGRVRAGSTCEDPICLVDLFATCAELTGSKPAKETAVDSVSFLGHLLGRSDAERRATVVHHSINGSFALRRGKWKLVFCPGSGGWSSPRPKRVKDLRKLSPEQRKKLQWVQLFDLTEDRSEQKNVAGEHPEVVKRMTAEIRDQIDRGRSTEGERQQNDGKTFLYPKWIRQAQAARQETK
ncbi:MAG: sulfatase-like hydrolase/transferase, partial [Planctomycetota bacterium]